MNQLEVSMRLKNLIMERTIMNLELLDIHESTNLVNDLKFDSIELIDLIITIESEFNIELEDDYLELDKMIDFSVLVSMVESNITKQLESQ